MFNIKQIAERDYQRFQIEQLSSIIEIDDQYNDEDDFIDDERYDDE